MPRGVSVTVAGLPGGSPAAAGEDGDEDDGGDEGDADPGQELQRRIEEDGRGGHEDVRDGRRQQEAAEPASKLNIVFILADDLGWGELGCYGQKKIPTPNIDRLAAEGMRFTQFYNSARCCPTRASLLTGLYPHQAGVGHMMEDKGLPGYRGDLSLRARTMISRSPVTQALRASVWPAWSVTRTVPCSGSHRFHRTYPSWLVTPRDLRPGMAFSRALTAVSSSGAGT